MSVPSVSQIVSGGQTGVDRAALDVAIALGIPHGGWCPRGRKAEDGTISNVYQLTETKSARYVVRTEKNVTDSDGTLILYRDRMSRGTALTASFTRRHVRPCLSIDIAAMQTRDLEQDWLAEKVAEIHAWLIQEGISTLNVAGPRESTSSGITDDARTLLTTVFDEIAEN
jgi:hypothetical protein